MQRLELAVAVVDDADGRLEPQLQRPLADHQRVVGVFEAAADHGVDVHVELGVLGQHLQLFVEDLEALLRDFVGLEVIDGDLHVVEAGAVQALDALGIEQIAVGDHAGDGAGAAHAADDVVEVGMGQRLAAGDADHGGAQAAQVVDAAVHLVERHGLGDLVVLVAVGAGEVAEARGHDLRQDRVAGGGQRARHHGVLAHLARGRDPAPAQRRSPGSGHPFY